LKLILTIPYVRVDRSSTTSTATRL